MSDFTRQGFDIYPQAIEAEVLAACLQDLPVLLKDARVLPDCSLMRRLYGRKPERFAAHEGLQIPEKEVYIAPNLAKWSQAFMQLQLQPRLWAWAARLLGVGDADLVLDFVNITRKPAGIGPKLNWHRDFRNKFISTVDPRAMLRLLVSLNGSAAGSGGTALVLGSHVDADAETCENTDLDAQDCLARSVTPSLAAGDVLAVSPLCIHGGEENLSDGDRDLLVMQFSVAGAALMYDEAQAEPFYRMSRMEIEACGVEVV